MESIYDLVEYMADVNSTVDPADAAQVLAKFGALAADINSKKYMQTKRLWQLGKLLVDNKTKLTVRDLAKTFGISRSNLQQAMAIVKYLNGDDEKFEAKYKEMGSPAFPVFAAYFLPYLKKRKVINKNSTIRSLKIIEDIVADLSNPEKAEEAIGQIRYLYAKLSRLVPPNINLQDRNYLPYSPCVCCGEYAPPMDTGYKLKTYKENIKYPICDACEDKEIPPNYDNLLRLYHTYAHNIELIIDKLEGNR